MSTQRMYEIKVIVSSPEGVEVVKTFRIPACSRPWRMVVDDSVSQLLELLLRNLRAQDIARIQEKQRRWKEKKQNSANIG